MLERLPAANAAGGLEAALLSQIRSGDLSLKAVAPVMDEAPLRRQPSGSLASVLRRRMAERKQALHGEEADGVDVEDEWK